jgi:hypothetical protein
MRARSFLFLCSALISAAALGPALCAEEHAAPLSKIRYVKFEDPFEHAFTAEVPEGWEAKGGTYRLGFSDVRPMMDLKSPDGKSNVRLGDFAIPPYSLPNRDHPREGDTLDLGAQAQLTIARYRSGQDFARLYAFARFRDLCQKLEPQPSDSAPPVKNYIPQDTPAVQSSDGQITYRCDEGGASRIAYSYAHTILLQGFWTVDAMASFIAPASEIASARAILLHVSETFTISPKWKEYQKQMDAEGTQYQIARQKQRLAALSAQVQQFEAKMRAMRNQVNAFERRQATQAAQVQSFDNALVGVTPTIDPLGNERDVWTGPHHNYWINGTGTVVNSDTSPGAGWQQLTPRQ